MRERRQTAEGKTYQQEYEKRPNRREYRRKWKREAYRQSRVGQPDRRFKPVPEEKQCTACSIVKPTTEFYLRKGRPTPQCKACTKKRSQQWADDNREAYLARVRSFYYDQRDTEEFQQKRRGRSRVNDQTKRARILNAPGRGVTKADWQERQELFTGQCAYCGEAAKLTMDHVEPLARGGAHDPENIAPACKTCNASKNDRFLLEWALAGFGPQQRAVRTTLQEEAYLTRAA